MDPEPPIIEAAISADDIPYVDPWRRRLWSVLATIVMAPIIGLLVIIPSILLVNAIRPDGLEWIALTVTTLVTGYLTYRFLRHGWKHGWDETNKALVGWGVLATLSTLFMVELYGDLQKVRTASQDKVMRQNLAQLAAAEEKLFTANPEKLFFTYDEIVGPGRPVPALKSIRDEDYRSLYPRHLGQTFYMADPISIIQWDVFDTTNPPGDWSNPRRCPLPNGGRLEYNEGNDRAPDGPVRFYRADGSLWAEAKCQAGRLIAPAWIYDRNGTRRNPFEHQ